MGKVKMRLRKQISKKFSLVLRRLTGYKNKGAFFGFLQHPCLKHNFLIMEQNLRKGTMPAVTSGEHGLSPTPLLFWL